SCPYPPSMRHWQGCAVSVRSPIAPHPYIASRALVHRGSHYISQCYDCQLYISPYTSQWPCHNRQGQHTCGLCPYPFPVPLQVQQPLICSTRTISTTSYYSVLSYTNLPPSKLYTFHLPLSRPSATTGT